MLYHIKDAKKREHFCYTKTLTFNVQANSLILIFCQGFSCNFSSFIKIPAQTYRRVETDDKRKQFHEV